MSLVDDDSLSGSIIKRGEEQVFEESTVKPKTLRDRIIDHVLTHEKPTKGSIYSHISASGTAGQIVAALISENVFIEHKFDCGNCVYFEIDKTKINIV